LQSEGIELLESCLIRTHISLQSFQWV